MIVFDYETQWMFEIQRHGKGFDYQALVFDYYESLRELGLDVDIVSSKTDLSSYRLVVVPSLAVIDDALVAQVERGSAQWVFGPRSAQRPRRLRFHSNAARRAATCTADASARGRVAACIARTRCFY